MPGDIFDEFNATLPEMAAMFGETWTIGSQEFDAISIEKLEVGSKVMHGGKLIDASTSVTITEDIYTDSAVKTGTIVTARDQRLAVLRVDSDGDASRTLICGPSQIDASW